MFRDPPQKIVLHNFRNVLKCHTLLLVNGRFLGPKWIKSIFRKSRENLKTVTKNVDDEADI